VLGVFAPMFLRFAMNPVDKPIAREWAILLVLAGVQISHILDFMILMPLGPQFMRMFAIGRRNSASWCQSILSAPPRSRLRRCFLHRPASTARNRLLFLYACFGATTLLAASATAMSCCWRHGRWPARSAACCRRSCSRSSAT